ncbi:Cytidine and deoxycytidylate deaminase family protein [Chitinispirillum alkaliphilum]|nr:Cytidine and deoxycytidylate deaminase family protein [Chitinispirillum alkaliphilum]
MSKIFTKNISIVFPPWLEDFLRDRTTTLATVEERMELVIELARKNIQKKTGGPFAAAIYNNHSGELVSAGINMVTCTNFSIAHAEIIAITQAQNFYNTFDLGSSEMPFLQLVTSTAPCAMCLGAIPWSGVKGVVCGARDEDARDVGFDEGAKYDDWIEQLQRRGIEVEVDICRKEASEVLREYSRSGGIIYNSREDG